MKYFYLFASLFVLFLSGYFLFLAFTSNDGMLLVLRGLAAVSLIFLSFQIYKNKKYTKGKRLERWFNKEKPKGFPRFQLKWVAAMVFVGYINWLMWSGIEDTSNLLISFLKYIALYVVIGFLSGWYMWRTNIKDARQYRLDSMDID